MSFSNTNLLRGRRPHRTLMLNRPGRRQNMFFTLENNVAHEIRELASMQSVREKQTRTRGHRSLYRARGQNSCQIGGARTAWKGTNILFNWAEVLSPTLGMYESIATALLPKAPGIRECERLFAWSAGRQRHCGRLVTSLKSAKESAVFRQVGPLMGSFEARLRYLVPPKNSESEKKKARSSGYRQPPRYAPRGAQKWGPDQQCRPRMNCAPGRKRRNFAHRRKIADRGPVSPSPRSRRPFNIRINIYAPARPGVNPGGGAARHPHTICCSGLIDKTEESHEVVIRPFCKRPTPDSARSLGRSGWRGAHAD